MKDTEGAEEEKREMNRYRLPALASRFKEEHNEKIIKKAVQEDVCRYDRDILKTRNRLIEAVWRVIVGNDTPEPEDGKMIKQPYVQTEYGPGSVYNFIYKGKPEVVLTEVQRVPGEFSYFLDSDREIIGEVIEKVTELAAEELVG